jgi:hypothetical protein
MYRIFLYKIALKLMWSGLASISQIRGCNRSEIREIATLSTIPLPKVYQAFLSVMGLGAGCFFRGTDIFYPDVLGCRMAAEELLEEDGSEFVLTGNHFVFAHHQGYQFMYFDLQEGSDDPAVYHYMEGKSPVKICERFSTYLLQSVRDFERIKAGIYKLSGS